MKAPVHNPAIISTMSSKVINGTNSMMSMSSSSPDNAPSTSTSVAFTKPSILMPNKWKSQKNFFSPKPLPTCSYTSNRASKINWWKTIKSFLNGSKRKTFTNSKWNKIKKTKKITSIKSASLIGKPISSAVSVPIADFSTKLFSKVPKIQSNKSLNRPTWSNG